jgi:hypothetical protein
MFPGEAIVETTHSRDQRRSDAAAMPARPRELPTGIAELTAFHGPLPSWYRYDVGAREPETTPRRAFEMLVSAACYLAHRQSAADEDSRDAGALLERCSQQLRFALAEVSSAPEELEAQIRQDKQIRWKRYSRMFGAAREREPQRGGTWAARWLQRWRGVPKIVAL